MCGLQIYVQKAKYDKRDLGKRGSLRQNKAVVHLFHAGNQSKEAWIAKEGEMQNVKVADARSLALKRKVSDSFVAASAMTDVKDACYLQCCLL